MKKIIIAIDGHSSTGKSTAAKQLAAKLGYAYIDTGAMYRSVTLFALQQKIIQNNHINENGLKKRMSEIEIRFKLNSTGGKQETWLNGVNVEAEIRSMEVSNWVSPIAKIGFVRDAMVDLQQKMGTEKAIVMDGRDIGTVVFPQAELKVFMTASAEIRAQRRYKELLETTPDANYNEILENLKSRDFMDSNREIAPLKPAHDAKILDNSSISREEQLQMLESWAIACINA